MALCILGSTDEVLCLHTPSTQTSVEVLGATNYFHGKISSSTKGASSVWCFVLPAQAAATFVQGKSTGFACSLFISAVWSELLGVSSGSG